MVEREEQPWMLDVETGGSESCRWERELHPGGGCQILL